MSSRILIVGALALILGCRPPVAKNSKSEPQKKQPSVAQETIEGFTGMTAVKQSQKARAKIESVSAQKKADLDEVQGQ